VHGTGLTQRPAHRYLRSSDRHLLARVGRGPGRGAGSAVCRRQVTLVKIVDSDTIDVNPGDERVRLLTINTPETHTYDQEPKPSDCGAQRPRTRWRVRSRSGGQVLLLGLPGEPATDDSPHHRTLANVYIERDGQLVDVSLWLAEQGWAVTLSSYPTSETERSKALQAQAQAAHRGMSANCPVRA
jgi:endonuclease YncB( thermonuclease family)